MSLLNRTQHTITIKQSVPKNTCFNKLSESGTVNTREKGRRRETMTRRRIKSEFKIKIQNNKLLKKIIMIFFS